ncbi:Phytochrome-like protein cph2 [compost metagenome]
MIARLPNSVRDAALVRSVIDLCKQFGMLVIAEGVETVAQYEWLQANGCEYVQGFLVARPMTSEDAGEFVQPFDWSALTR